MLFLGPKATLATAAQVELAAWARDVNNRSASSAEELAIPAYPQQTLRYVLTKTACVPRGLGDVGVLEDAAAIRGCRCVGSPDVAAAL